LNNRVSSDSGYKTWKTLNGKLLTGFSHGAAGIAYSLLRSYKISGQTIFLEAAQESISYERSVFNREVGNWPDFRFLSTEDLKYQCGWAHGAPGIGLARVAGLDILNTDEIQQDIESAIKTTMLYGLSNLDHLCNGNLGRVEFLFTAAQKTSQPQLQEIAMTQVEEIIARAKQKGHFGYEQFLSFNPVFFEGAAGIGYQFLRLAYPDILPSVLILE
jgi:lantibiotic modifying enzyme